jgi:hypothetical protein
MFRVQGSSAVSTGSSAWAEAVPLPFLMGCLAGNRREEQDVYTKRGKDVLMRKLSFSKEKKKDILLEKP